MRHLILALLGTMILAVTSAAQPVPGSPGRVAGIATAPGACPTFSWSSVDKATGYELVVFRVDGERDGVPAEPAVRKYLDPGITTWTPSLEECLSPGSRYAWTVRAGRDDGWTEWSKARLFRVPAGPSRAEVERAVAVLRAYAASPDRPERDRQPARDGVLRPDPVIAGPTGQTEGADPAAVAIRGEVPDAAGMNVGVLGSVASTEAGSAGLLGEATATSGDVAGIRATTASPGGTAGRFESDAGGDLLRGIAGGIEVFSIDATGSVVAESFAGDGSGLTGVPPAGHTHDGSDIDAGVVAEPFVDSALARDAEILPTVLADDGPGSGLDADTLDGVEAAAFATAAALASHAGDQSNPHSVSATQTTPATTKGDLEVFDGSVIKPLRIGAVGQVLKADPASSLGLVWGEDDPGPVDVGCGLGEVVVGFGPDGSIVCDTLATDSDHRIPGPFSKGYDSSVAVGTDGLPIFAGLLFDASGFNLEVIHCEDAACLEYGRTTLDTFGITDFSCDLAIGSDGLPVIAYFRGSDSKIQVAHCDDVACTSATLEGVEAGILTERVSLAIGSDGLPVIAYATGFDEELRVAHCEDLTCSTSTLSTVDDTGDVGWSASIAIGSDGLPVVSYGNRSSGTLRFAKCSAADCSSAIVKTLDVIGAGFFPETSIAVDPVGRPFVTYFEDVSGTYRLNLLVCSNATCGSNQVRAITYVGTDASRTFPAPVAFGPDGLATMGYYADNVEELGLARCHDSECSSLYQTVLGQGRLEHPSMVLDEDGRPVAVVQDRNGSDPAVIRCANAWCS